MALARSFSALLFVGTACNLSLEDKPAPVPDGYPKLGEYEDGKADLTIDDEHHVTEYSSGTRYNTEGGYDDDLRASSNFDDLDLTFRDVEVDTYTIASGDLVASYSYSATADEACGDGQIEIVGRRHYDSGLLGERELIWGTIQLELCDDDGGLVEVSGRFSSIVTRS